MAYPLSSALGPSQDETVSAFPGTTIQIQQPVGLLSQPNTTSSMGSWDKDVKAVDKILHKQNFDSLIQL